MTDYDDKELSTDEGAPLELYEFIGTYRSYFMTSDAIAYTLSGKTYLPTPGLKRDEIIISSHEDDAKDLNIEIPITEQMVIDYGFQTTPPALDLVIHRIHRGTGTDVTYWAGPVTSFVINGDKAKIRSPSKFQILLSGNVPNVYVQPVCNNALFDARCKVPRVANSLDTSVLTYGGLIVVLPSLGGFPDGFFVGGEIVIPAYNERRMITAQAGTALTINYPFVGMASGTTVQVTGGCDHSYEGPNGCPKYANQRNFGGTPFAPGESLNPFTKGLFGDAPASGGSGFGGIPTVPYTGVQAV